MKVSLPTKEQIEENYGYSIHEACTRLNMGINALKELCRSYNIPRWPKVRKVRSNSDSFQCFSINKIKLSTEKKPHSILKQTKTLTLNLELLHLQVAIPTKDNRPIVQPNQKETTQSQPLHSKISIKNLCN
jgi:hypothetical protein